MSSASINSAVEEMITPYLEENNFELVGVEYEKEGSSWFLRVFVDKEGGIDIEDCGHISEVLSQKLDEGDPIRDAYFLEVSSPGAERPLKKAKDFVKAVGKYVHVTTYEPIDGIKEFEGVLSLMDEETVVVQIGEEKHVIPYEKIASARLAIVF